jgi:acid phosphatase family membrane protein YuiD
MAIEIIRQLFTNEIFLSVLIATAICQIWKGIGKSIEEKKLDWRQFYANGGMPSSHTTFVTSLSLSVGFVEGFTSTIFLVSLAFSLIVIRDAMGVRHIVDDVISHVNMLMKKEKISGDVIRKIAGHTPFQVVVGFILGIIITLIVHYAL